MDLGRCLTALGRHAEAEELLLSNVGAEEVTPEILRQTREAPVELYEACGKAAEAARERRSLEELGETS